MNFNELDKKMRFFETANDHCVLPDMYMVARLDGRGFTKLTKEKHSFVAPFDERFKDLMVGTVNHLMQCGFKINYGYVQSDEISLLFDLNCTSFNRKERKINSVLAGEASAKFSLLLGDIASFDCRISKLPNKRLVVDYFRWRHEDAHCNSLNAHCYWLLRGEGISPNVCADRLAGLSIADKNELLFNKGINFNELPSWQKRGIGVFWQQYQKEGMNPTTGKVTFANRTRLTCLQELPLGDEYSGFIKGFLAP